MTSFSDLQTFFSASCTHCQRMLNGTYASLGIFLLQIFPTPSLPEKGHNSDRANSPSPPLELDFRPRQD